MIGRILCLSCIVLACAPAQQNSVAPAERGDYLYVWAQPADSARPSILGVFDLAHPNQPLKVIPVDSPSSGAHHTEYYVTEQNTLFANAFRSGRTFLFDLSQADRPRVIASLGDVASFSHPHSYARLPNGHALATFQWRVDGSLPGGLVELDTRGQPVRWASAATPEADSLQIVPYSLVVMPALDRVVSTSTHMMEDIGVHVQIWRLSDLKLLRTLQVPAAGTHGEHATHAGEHHMLPGEPRVLADGKTVMFGTFTCGLYHLTGVDGNDPKLVFSHAFPGDNCAVPVVIGKYWVQTVPALRAVIALDVTTPARPRETSRLVFGDSVAPHWLASDAAGRRLVMSSARKRDPTLYLIDFDAATGVLTRRTDTPILDMRGVEWPDGYRGMAVPHGVVFGRR